MISQSDNGWQLPEGRYLENKIINLKTKLC
jgi:hypothetical protein